MAASNKDLLVKTGITHILTVAKDHPPKFPSSFTYKVVKVLDLPSTNLKQRFMPCIQFIQDAVSKNGKVFVHCYAGVSRSATIVIAYLMLEHGLSFSAAIKLVKSKRPFINPNDGFRKQLLLFEKDLRQQKSQKENVQTGNLLVTQGMKFQNLISQADQKFQEQRQISGISQGQNKMQLSKLIQQSLGMGNGAYNSDQHSIVGSASKYSRTGFLGSMMPATQLNSNRPNFHAITQDNQSQPLSSSSSVKINQQHKIQTAQQKLRDKSQRPLGIVQSPQAADNEIGQYKQRGKSEVMNGAKIPFMNLRLKELDKQNQQIKASGSRLRQELIYSSNHRANNLIGNGIMGVSKTYNHVKLNPIQDQKHSNILGMAIADSRFGMPLNIQNF
ncbi:protein-tyrosine phosphatase [Stylonychia lemnae]|uniref:protein-tyrosine-phosphatase n=1 Tax=Stylonychia lemnae TaxID=5949 RepID=A0A078A9R8_STYLE|nr:protein-tyrosine phosphatase [Stylonychia lemnae]|eukprot:CDW78924.1 protein-tyrosine phosphatase [Stylonychia lemnae]